ncbi:MAG: DUF4157 domain-containing protein, partial [Anaerolineales bacterium]|nr:DUF4157 domain-containing protein [Anaerolineales bacterium]
MLSQHKKKTHVSRNTRQAVAHQQEKKVQAKSWEQGTKEGATAVAQLVPALQRAYHEPRTLTPVDAQTLQRTVGNQAVGRLLRSPLQRQEDEEELQLKTRRPSSAMMQGGELSTSIESQIQNARGGGRPLPSKSQASMGQAFNADFSGVNIHTDSQADHLNQSLYSRAFTTGQDIFFRQGEYNPDSSSGQELLAHELTHVMQQNGRSQRISRWGGPGNTTSHEDVTADALSRDNLDQIYSAGAIKYMESMSETIDMRLGFLAPVVAGKFRQLFSAMKNDPDAYRNLSGYWRPSSEAPNHGEGAMYQEGAEGVGPDRARVQSYIDKALVAWDQDNPRQSLSMLGLALHSAEDRGSHGDGMPGTGHDPRRLIPPPPGLRGGKTAVPQKYFYQSNPNYDSQTNPVVEWKGSDCDLRDKNEDGYTNAIQYAVEVLQNFQQAIADREESEDLQNFKEPGDASRRWRKVKLFFGAGHPTHEKWEQWSGEGKTGTAKKVGATLLGPLEAISGTVKGGVKGAKAGHWLSSRIWTGREGSKKMGGLLGLIKKGWTGKEGDGGLLGLIKKGWTGKEGDGGLLGAIKKGWTGKEGDGGLLGLIKKGWTGKEGDGGLLGAIKK